MRKTSPKKRVAKSPPLPNLKASKPAAQAIKKVENEKGRVQAKRQNKRQLEVEFDTPVKAGQSSHSHGR